MLQQWARQKYGVRLMIVVIPHTFGGHLNFNCHLHILVSEGGLREDGARWRKRASLDQDALMPMWRYAVITLLREADRAGVLDTDMTRRALRQLLTTQYERWWNTNIQRFRSKKQFLGYAGRYARRPPIAQHRFRKIDGQEIRFVDEGKTRPHEARRRNRPAMTTTVVARAGPESEVLASAPQAFRVSYLHRPAWTSIWTISIPSKRLSIRVHNGCAPRSSSCMKQQQILLALMIPLVMIVDDVLPKRMTERLLAEQDELRETFLFDQFHPALRERVQIRAPCGQLDGARRQPPRWSGGTTRRTSSPGHE